MKCLTLMQPWATLIAVGAKRVETRSWATAYRGPLAIHASVRLPAAARALFAREPFAPAFRQAGILRAEDFPLGKVLAVCRLVECQRITVENWPAEPEASFGDYTPGRWAWLLDDVELLEEPVPARGKLGLW